MIQWNYEMAKQEFEDKGLILLETKFKSVDTPMSCIAKCGHKKKLTISNLLINHGLYCRECSYKVGSFKRKYDFYYVNSYFENEGCKLLSTEYIRADSSLKYIARCGHENKITFTKFKNNCQGRLCRSCGRPKKEKHFNYNPNLTNEERIKNRDYYEIVEWRLKIFERDNHTCQYCGDSKGGNLNAHHLDGYNWCKEKRTDVNNGVTLCENCHTNFHNTYGYGNNTREQFEEWSQGKIIEINKMIRNSGIGNKEIVQLSLEDMFIKEWNSAREAYESLNICFSNICNVCRGKRKTSGGFKWMYKEDYDQYIKQAN